MDPDLQSTLSDITKNLGAVLVDENQTRFRVWAPKAKQIHVELVQRSGQNESLIARHGLDRNEHGVFDGVVDDCPAGTLYRYSIDGQMGRPDPRSRFQPFGVHGPSQVVDGHRFEWSDQDWAGVKKRDLVIYELHIGSFTDAGTYDGAIARLEELTQLGVTAIELLPLAQSPGQWNWGYDGVNYFAPRNTFGTPDQLKAFIDACHGKNLAVIIDVVYNHVGPEGNYLSEFGPYRSKKYGTPWGDAFNFDSLDVRRFVLDNVLFWLQEYHFDGLRLDAVHYMFDDQKQHILSEIQSEFRAFEKTIDREIHLIGESNIYDPELVGDVESGRPNYDAIWSDCLMHSIYSLGNSNVRLTDRHYNGASDVAEALEHAYVFSTPQAVRVDDKKRAKNHPTDDRTYIESLVMALQTHDSVGNHPHGKRIHQLTSVEFQLAAAPLILLYPSIPMIFMGEEWAAESPFPFFADFEDLGLRKAVDQGRRDEYPHHDWVGSPLPSDPLAFSLTKPNPANHNQRVNQWYRSLLELRRTGIESGWLSVDNMSVQSDLSQHIYRLTYTYFEGTLNIVARLEPEQANSIPLSSFSIQQILLDSRQAAQETTALQPQHSVVWLS